MMNMNPVALVGNFAKNKVWCKRLLVISVGLITIASVIPYGFAGSTVTVVCLGPDKILHFIGFTFLILFAFGAGNRLGFWHGFRAVAYVLLFGIAMEFVQYYIPYRTFNPVDIVANLCGVLFGVLLWILFIAQSAWREAQSGKRMEQSR